MTHDHSLHCWVGETPEASDGHVPPGPGLAKVPIIGTAHMATVGRAQRRGAHSSLLGWGHRAGERGLVHMFQAWNASSTPRLRQKPWSPSLAPPQTPHHTRSF